MKLMNYEGLNIDRNLTTKQHWWSTFQLWKGGERGERR